MAQYARPTSDTSVGDWSPPPLFEKVGGSTPNDATVIHGVGDSPCVIALSPITTPAVGTVTLKLRAQRGANSPDAGLTAELLSAGLVVAARNLDALTTSIALLTIDLTTAERDAITDWGTLAVRLTATELPPNTVHYGTDPVAYALDPVVYGATP